MCKRFFLLALASAVTSAACADSPEGVSPTATDAKFDGGWTIGSGGRTDTTTTVNAAGESGADCTAETGGWTIGSGGATQPLPSQCEVQ
jgi:hypothetical protein